MSDSYVRAPRRASLCVCVCVCVCNVRMYVYIVYVYVWYVSYVIRYVNIYVRMSVCL